MNQKSKFDIWGKQDRSSEKELEEIDAILKELVPAILDDNSKTDIKKLHSDDFDEVINFLSGLLQNDFFGAG